MSAAWRGRMANWPSLPGTMRTSTPLSVRTIRSAVTISTVSGIGSGLSHRAAGFDDLVDVALHVEGLFRQPVVGAIEDLFEAADGVADADVLARDAREGLGNIHRLREE